MPVALFCILISVSPAKFVRFYHSAIFLPAAAFRKSQSGGGLLEGSAPILSFEPCNCEGSEQMLHFPYFLRFSDTIHENPCVVKKYWERATPKRGSTAIECMSKPIVQPFPSRHLHLRVFACIILHSFKKSQCWRLCSEDFFDVSGADKGAKTAAKWPHYSCTGEMRPSVLKRWCL